MIDHQLDLKDENCMKGFFSAPKYPGRLDQSITLLRLLVDHGATLNSTHLPLVFRISPELFEEVLRLQTNEPTPPHCFADCIFAFESQLYYLSIPCRTNLMALLTHLRRSGHGNAEIFGQHPTSGRTPFCIDLPNDITEMLIAEGGDVNLRSRSGMHPILFARLAYNSSNWWEAKIAFWSKIGVRLHSSDMKELLRFTEGESSYGQEGLAAKKAVSDSLLKLVFEDDNDDWIHCQFILFHFPFKTTLILKPCHDGHLSGFVATANVPSSNEGGERRVRDCLHTRQHTSTPLQFRHRNPLCMGRRLSRGSESPSQVLVVTSDHPKCAFASLRPQEKTSKRTN